MIETVRKGEAALRRGEAVGYKLDSNYYQQHKERIDRYSTEMGKDYYDIPQLEVFKLAIKREENFEEKINSCISPEPSTTERVTMFVVTDLLTFRRLENSYDKVKVEFYGTLLILFLFFIYMFLVRKSGKIMKRILNFLSIIIIGICIFGVSSCCSYQNEKEKLIRQQEQKQELLNKLDNTAKEIGRNLANDILKYTSEQQNDVYFPKDAVKQKIKYVDDRTEEAIKEAIFKLKAIKNKYDFENVAQIEIDSQRIQKQFSQISEICKPVFYFNIYIMEANKNLNIKYLDKARECLINSKLDLDRKILNDYINAYKKGMKEYKKNKRMSEKTLNKLRELENIFYQELQLKTSQKELEKTIKQLNEK